LGDKDEYREKIRAILIRFQEDELMTVNRTVDEIVDQIVEIELPEKG
jgi:transcription antitermination factor NusA-like protein